MNDYQNLVKAGITTEQEVITNHFCYFGPVPETLYQQIKDEKWRSALRLASRMVEEKVEEQPNPRSRVWGEDKGERALDMLSGMTKLDPTARVTIDQVPAHSCWREGVSRKGECGVRACNRV